MEERKKYCKFCGSLIDYECIVCPSCGKQVEVLQKTTSYTPQVVVNTVNTNQNANSQVSQPIRPPKRCEKVTALLLCIFLGWLGAHKFYEGKTGLGVLYLFTCGLFFVGWFIDIIIIATKPEVYYVY
jgi:restriction system protein